MPVPTGSHLQHWKLSEEENDRAAIVNRELLCKLETMNAELAESLAEFTFEAGGDSGTLLNAIDFWQLRGRRSLVLQLLQEYDEATGHTSPPEQVEESSLPLQF